MKANKRFFLMFLGFLAFQSMVAQLVTHHNAVYQGDLAQPLPGILFTDPNFHTPVVRLTDARTSGIHGLFPDYSKRQAWNSNETLMLLRSGWSDAYLYNGQNYQFIKALEGVAGDDVFWHPSNPELVLFNPDTVLFSYNVITDEVRTVHTFNSYAWANTRGEGNISNDGRYYAVVGRTYDNVTGEVSFRDLIVYDIQEDRVASTMALPAVLADFDWVSISPLGNYVIVDYADKETGRYHGIEVYDRNFNFIWQKGLGAGHSDLGLDASGEEVLIMDIYDDDSNLNYINKYSLANGTTTQLLSVAQPFDLHISCRAMNRPGWVYISTFDSEYRLTDGLEGWLPFEDEVFALKMDGSGGVERYAHHRSREYSPATPDRETAVYFAEPHATVDHSGRRVLFGSNWRIHIEEDYSIDAYLIDLTNLITAIPEEKSDLINDKYQLFPNPVSDQLFFSSKVAAPDCRIRLYNSLGMFLVEFIVDQENTNLDIRGLPAGLIYYQIIDKNGISRDSGKIIRR
ncbi:MAG: T9SS type A sorting domain-containing protein [Bacteroidales bacterium]|jgi:hypothetical protein